MKYRKKPVVVDAVQIISEDSKLGSVGDWVITAPTGEFRVCKQDMFEEIYEPAEMSTRECLDCVNSLLEKLRQVVKDVAAKKVTLEDCPSGLFAFEGSLCFKSEYYTNSSPDAYVVQSGEYFWGGTNEREKRDALMVLPLDINSFWCGRYK